MSNSDDSSPEDYILDESSDPDGHLALGLRLEGGSDFEGAIEALSRAIDSELLHRELPYCQTVVSLVEAHGDDEHAAGTKTESGVKI